MLQISNYNSVREQLRPGDLITFGGEGMFSSVIKIATGITEGLFRPSPASHSAAVIEMQMSIPEEGGAQEGKVVWIIESTTLYKNKTTGASEKGVYPRRLSDRVEEYNGNVWAAFLRDEFRKQVDWNKYMDLAWRQKGKGYNMVGAVLAGGWIPVPTAWSGTLFCSQLVVWLLKECGVKELAKVLPEAVNPQELAEMNLWDPVYYQLKGKRKELPRFNSKAPWATDF